MPKPVETAPPLFGAHLDPVAEAAAANFIARVMRNRRMLNAYNSMPEMNRALINSSFHTWANEHNLSPKARNELHMALNVRTRAEFMGYMKTIIDWVRDKVGDRPYALIAEITNTDLINGYTLTNAEITNGKLPRFVAKSSAWLAGPVVRELPRKPDLLIPFYGDSKLSYLLMEKALKSGIRDFVHIDDAMYSGQQKATLITKMQQVFLMSTFEHPETKLSGRMKPRLWLAVAFATQQSKNLIADTSQASRNLLGYQISALDIFNIKLLAPGTIHAPKLASNTVKEELRDKRHVVGPTMTLLPFKVPNTVSFGPPSLSNALSKTVKKPVYKRIDIEHPPIPHVPTKLRTRSPTQSPRLPRLPRLPSNARRLELLDRAVKSLHTRQPLQRR